MVFDPCPNTQATDFYQWLFTVYGILMGMNFPNMEERGLS